MKGTVRFTVKDTTGAVRTVELKDVNYVPRVALNLFSVMKALIQDGFKIHKEGRSCVLHHAGELYEIRDSCPRERSRGSISTPRSG